MLMSEVSCLEVVSLRGEWESRTLGVARSVEFKVARDNSVDGAGQLAEVREKSAGPGLSPLAARVLRMLKGRPRCALALAADVRCAEWEAFAALVQLADRGLAGCEHHKRAVPGYGMQRIWVAGAEG